MLTSLPWGLPTPRCLRPRWRHRWRSPAGAEPTPATSVNSRLRL